ncbi:von Willebrand factor type A domain-containing protein [Aspergillus spectabilis]
MPLGTRLAMATIPGIVFDAVEPPNPYLDDRTWLRIPASSQYYPRRYDAIPTPAWPPAHEQPRQEPSKQRALLPPFSVSLAISVTQGMAKAVVTQSFRNDAALNIEKGTYQFPLPHESSIVNFKCQIGATKALQGVVKPRPEAKSEFNSAVKRGRPAGLVEQDSPEIFKTEIGNIPAHTAVEVKISFIFFLKYRLSDDETTTVLTIPTYIAPRYGNPEFQLGETGPQTNTKLSLEIDILAGNEIRNVSSDTHQVVVEREVRQRRCQRWADFVAASASPSPQSQSVSVKLGGENDCLDRDFVLVISAHPSVEEELPHATLELHPDLEGSSAMMVEIPPSFMLRGQAPMEDTEVIFLADRSESMLDKISGLKSSLQFFLRGLPRSRFNLYCFGSSYESLWETSQPYGDNTLSEALNYVSGFTNNMGGTDLLPALQSVVASRRRGSLDVIVLTDGEVWQLQKTIEFVRNTCAQSEGSVRFFALGIGHAVSHDLVEGIAKAGGGYAEVIPTASSSGWETQVVAVLKAAITGHVTDIAIEVEGLDLQPKGEVDKPPTILVSPGNICNLSPFQRNRIFILAQGNQLNDNSQIQIKRKSIMGQRIITYVPVHKLQERDSTVHKFATRALLGDLERGKSWIYGDDRVSRGSKEAQKLTIKEGERLGCQASLVSRWTSFVAVETVDGDESDKSSPERKEYAASTSSDQTISGTVQLDVEDGDDDLINIPHSLNHQVLQQGPILNSASLLDSTCFNCDFSASGTPDVLENFDFDTFLNSDHSHGFPFTAFGTSSTTNIPSTMIWSDGVTFNSRAGLSQARESPSKRARYASRSAHWPPSLNSAVPPPQPQTRPLSQAPRQPRFSLTKGSSHIKPKKRASQPEGATLKPSEDNDLQKQRAFVRQILQFQKSDGAFEVPMAEAKGLDFGVHGIVEALLAKGTDFTIAVTIVFVVLLEAELRRCRGLWLRMVEKAREYILLHLAPDDVHTLTGLAEGIVKSRGNGGNGGQSALLFDGEKGDYADVIDDFVISSR